MVAPTDIEHVHVGQAVNVRLTAYKAHQVPVVTGHLVYVSADRQIDPQNQPVFKARATLDADALKGLHGVALYAGMPADVLIIGGARTALDYLISPIRDSMGHAMHED
jgi:HlyD family secretion protein